MCVIESEAFNVGIAPFQLYSKRVLYRLATTRIKFCIHVYDVEAFCKCLTSMHLTNVCKTMPSIERNLKYIIMERHLT